jgi:hypothetical protein
MRVIVSAWTSPDSDALADMQKSQDRTKRGERMDSSEYRAALKAMNLSQVRAGRWLGISGRTSQAYALGERPIPHVVALCIRTHIKQGWVAPQWEFRKAGWQVPHR